MELEIKLESRATVVEIRVERLSDVLQDNRKVEILQILRITFGNVNTISTYNPT